MDEASGLRGFGAPDALRWGGALLAVLGLHALAVVLIMDRTVAPPLMPAAPEAVMLDLAPDLPPLQEAAMAPPSPAAVPPPPMPAAEIPPAEMPPIEIPPVETPPIELPPTPPVVAEAVLPVPPPPRPPPPRVQPRPKPLPVERPVVERQTPVREETPPPAALAPTGPAQPSARPPAPPSNAMPTWRSELLARLQRAKRYPDLARSRGAQGVATVSFTMDRGGRVIHVGLVGSAGSPLLDEEAVALVHRAEPLPPVPDEIAGATVTLTVPISFALR